VTRSRAANLPLGITLAGEPPDGAALALGRTAGARSPRRGRRRFRFSWWRHRAQVLKQHRRCVGRSAPLGKARERHGHDVAGADASARGIDAQTVEPNMTTVDQ
jgi:hypothetical protein